MIKEEILSILNELEEKTKLFGKNKFVYSYEKTTRKKSDVNTNRINPKIFDYKENEIIWHLEEKGVLKFDCHTETQRTSDSLSDSIIHYTRCIVVNLDKLKQYKNELSDNKSSAKLRDTKKITEITVIKGNNRNKNRIAINNNYAESFEIIDSTSKNIISLMNAILDGTGSLKEIEDLENCRSYLNSNSNCRIYKDKTGKKQIYITTKIVDYKDRHLAIKELEISNKIKTNVITHSQFQGRLSKQRT